MAQRQITQRQTRFDLWAAAVVLFLAGVPVLGGDLVRDFGLRKTTVRNATVYYDPVLEKQLPVLDAEYGKFNDKILSKMGVAKDKVEPICEVINRMIGTDRDEARQTASRVLTDMGQLWNSLSFEDPVFYLVQKEPTKAYLRKGGTLPHFSYDKATNTASFEFKFGKQSSEGDKKLPLELVFPIDPNTADDEAVTGEFALLSEVFGQMMESVIIHEAAEMTLVYELNTPDWYKRWFTDGFANVVTYYVLRDVFSQKEADEFLACFSVEEYQDMQSQVNLRYWMSVDYEFFDMAHPFGPEKRLEQARYNYATLEAMGLTKRHGDDCLKKIVDAYTAKGNHKTEGLYDAIAEVTGENLEHVLAKYQSFEDAMKGLTYYVALGKAAEKNKDINAKIETMLRAMELFNDPASLMSLTTRREIAVELMRIGRQDLGDWGVLKFAQRMMDAKNRLLLLRAEEFVMVYAGNTQRLLISEMYGKAMLKLSPREPVVVNGLEQIQRLRQQYPQQAKFFEQSELKGTFYQQAKTLLESAEKGL